MKPVKSHHLLSSEIGSAGRSPSRPERSSFTREAEFSKHCCLVKKSILPVGCYPAADPPESAPETGTSASLWAHPASRPA